MSDWLTYSPTSGHGNGTITITAATNSELEDRVASVVARNNDWDLSAITEVFQSHTEVTGISINNLTWVNNIPWYGGIATKSNCSYNVVAHYDDGTTADITQLAEVSGETVVCSSSAQTVTTAGTLSLTATYEQFTATASTTFETSSSTIIYQDEFENIDFEKEYFTIVAVESGIFGITGRLLYSINNGNWVDIPSATTLGMTDNWYDEISLNSGDKVRFKRNPNAPIGYADVNDFTHFGGTNEPRFIAYGNLMSLFDADSFSSRTSFVSYTDFWGETKYLTPSYRNQDDDYYYGMFTYSHILSAKYLIMPVTNLVDYCYSDMFRSCWSLVEAPSSLPATVMTKECYYFMFQGCTGLTTAPELPATTLEEKCYDAMFYLCKSLTTAPAILPATTLAKECYRDMFYGCTSLTTAPELPATTLAEGCYQYMFFDCHNLNYIKCLATDISASNCTTSWTMHVSYYGTFVKNPSMASWTTGDSGIPSGWTVQNAT